MAAAGGHCGTRRVGTAIAAGAALCCLGAPVSAEDGDLPPFMPDIARLLASYRTAAISEDAVAEGDWPFVAGAGRLTCIRYLNQDWAFFEPEGAPDDADGFPIVADPGTLFATALGQPGVLKPFPGFPELIRRMAATREVSLALCAEGEGFLEGIGENPHEVPAPQ